MELFDEVIALAMESAFPKARSSEPVEMSFVRDLHERDLEALNAGVRATEGRQPLLNLRASHHALARCVAEGKSDVESSAITGYAPSTISSLKKDPAFSELVAHYTLQIEGLFLDVHERLKNLGLTSIEILQERMNDAPGDFKIRELLEVAQLSFDRAGFGPSSKVTHTHAHFSLDQLKRLKEEAATLARGHVRTIDLTAVAEGGSAVIRSSHQRESASDETETEGN